MNRNGMVFVPREPPKRVILYPLQDSVNQTQVNGLYQRAKTEILISNHTETLAQSSNSNRPARQQPLSSLPNGTFKPNEKSNSDGTVFTSLGHSAALSAGQKVQNPYYANPFFRPRVITNQQSVASTSASTASSVTTTDVTIPTIVSSSVSSTLPNRGGKPPAYPRIQSSFVFSHGKPPDATINNPTVLTSPPQDDNRPWAQPAISTHIVRCNGTSGPPKASETNATSDETLKQKGSSATDILISLMDTSAVSHNSASSSTANPPAQSNGARNDSATSGSVFSSSEQPPSTPPFSLVDISSTASNNNQNWKKALVANFQKNHRNVPSAKLLYTKQPNTPLPTTTPIRAITPLQTTASSSNETLHQQQQQPSKPKQFTTLNVSSNERPTEGDENSVPVPNSARRSSESLLVPKPETNTMERSASLQIPKFTHSQTTNNTGDASNSNGIPYYPMSIPSALLMSKLPANIEHQHQQHQQQQRANITRVMIRRDFVKPLESRPPMPAASNMRPPIPTQSMKSETVPTNNVIRVATITESPNRAYTSQQQQNVHLSQKSLLSFTSSNSTTKDAIRTDSNQHNLNRSSTDGRNSASTTRTKQSSTSANSDAISRDEAKRRRKEEIDSITKRRSASASATSDYE